ncbi:uncharacterized protein J4E87_002679 [Alternaria ethzedia]|uniref:uncharacterized protein n=1 Tax=Alternaria ethzedia TaxID=181014 RepID=UPI0020C288E8|nr:uncharacterized protein J4E87_002679 [Alternaria ethzedia]KAI4631972.1 hypothetical protein J4E87_002679 [Alternaria ethzedia]
MSNDGVSRQSVARILHDAQVRVLGYGLVKRVRPGQTPSLTPRTLLVTSDVSVDGQYSAWKVAVSDLRLLFDKANREDITVELTDIRTADGVPSAPLTDCAPELVAAWECYRPALLEDIQERQWLTADIVLREIGELQPIRAPTLLITAQDADSAIWWDRILPHIRQLLPQTMEVDLLYAPHLAMQTSGDEEEAEEPRVRPAIYSTMQDYDAIVEMGASIGVEQPDNSGTVGAVLVLKDAAGNETNCALTNHHVVATHDPTSVINRGMSIGEHLGVNHEISQLGLVKIKAPSNPDHTRFLKCKAMDKYEHDQDVASFDNPYHPEYARAQSRAAATNRDCQVLDADPNRLLGTVIASSGYRVRENDDYTSAEVQTLSTVDNVLDDAFKRKDGTFPPSLADQIAGRTLKFALDWALIKVATGRTMSDRVPIGGAGIKVPQGKG